MTLDIVLAFALLLLALSIAFVAWGFHAYRRKANRYFEYLPRHIWNSISLQNLIGSPTPLPSPTGWAADSDLLAELSRLVASTKPATIVELGSGLSTAVIAAALRQNGTGRLISIDHDADYAHSTRQTLELAGLQAYVEILVVPLARQLHASSDAGWYNVSELTIPDNIDLVFVDGPPAALDKSIRSPALDYFWPLLSVGGSIVLDDTDRPAERAFTRDWLDHRPDAVVSRPYTFKGCTIITKRSS